MVVDLPDLLELDINPLLADDKGVLALDARVLVAPDRDARSSLVIRPVPTEWARTVETVEGRSIFVRPVRPDDADRLVRFYRRLNDEDRLLRFMAATRGPDPVSIARLTQIDYRRAMNFLAFDKPDGEETIAAAELFADPEHERAEVAIAVRSDVAGQGIGRAMMRHLIDYAEVEGIACLEGLVRVDNRRMIDFARRSGARVEAVPGEDGVMTVSKSLR